MSGGFYPVDASKGSGLLAFFSKTSLPTQVLGLSGLASLFSRASSVDTLKLIAVGSVFETGRRVFQWLYERFQFRYSISAQFSHGDPAYDWIILHLNNTRIWRRAPLFKVVAQTSLRRWGVGMLRSASTTIFDEDVADYVPLYSESPILFRWEGYWVEVKQDRAGVEDFVPRFGYTPPLTINLKIYTRDIHVLSKLIETAKQQYNQENKTHVVVHNCSDPQHSYSIWTQAKKKSRRELSSVVLEDGVLDTLLTDAREFLKMESWYKTTGVPHKRGYLLYGPPGTGKSSTIHALAGELSMEIYSLSLAAPFVDDSYLQQAISVIPKNSILVIEDIDCAFPSRDDEEEEDISKKVMPYPFYPWSQPAKKSSVTLSGLLNALDGVSSEEGSLFFATTNYIDRLDPALIRPGRIDIKIEYKLATKGQASSLFTRFYPSKSMKLKGAEQSQTVEYYALILPVSEKPRDFEDQIRELAERFSAALPENEFTTAELQGYLLGHKQKPEGAVNNLPAWIEKQRQYRKEREQREAERKAKAVATKAEKAAKDLKDSDSN
ncbi:P-loop containing nucleoside triphosphate hydrolase protein [Coprinopsis marcescibilis]|uniref:P-loop containing nucleoside triphosphate hydrolase protein n=1 Tax=Coprinopsis marcescibilis TaxID=230819 RepID=A0A5C3L3I4_COPMA|nr:P-loop containing nucleoside triphosphate hydrolase protein [Coprinopsis marcescibilis]